VAPFLGGPFQIFTDLRGKDLRFTAVGGRVVARTAAREPRQQAAALVVVPRAAEHRDYQ
jgi:hypothetical protein